MRSTPIRSKCGGYWRRRISFAYDPPAACSDSDLLARLADWPGEPDIIIVQSLGGQKWKVNAIDVLSGRQIRDFEISELEMAWRDVFKDGGNVTQGTFDADSKTGFPSIAW